ncbi:hypothetical protein [Mycobacterium hubeiense]|uniref:hypothetical protein n=1 Tax=Mycobacterium hubeiense TaxID=1867256 RepID=UPI000C7EAB01|nr:hypothetical protein [Mycobacterium sp. QGD 101]
MADQQDRPDEKPDAPAGAAEPSGASTDPAPPEAPVKKTPAKKAAKKAPAKKAPAKAAKKAPAKKAPAKKSAAKKAPPKKAAALADTNGDLASAAKETAAHAKSTVTAAANPVNGPAVVPAVGPEQSRLPLAAAIAAGVLAILIVVLARRHTD